MATDIVVDASVLGKLLVPEPDSAQVAAAWAESAHLTFRAPTLLRYELGNLLRKVRGPVRDMKDADLRNRALAEVLEGVELVETGVSDAFAVQGSLSFYDASYLAVAKATGSALVTADDDLRKQAKRVGVPLASL